ncbi:MAG: protein-L-isoaspartate(D-aspartate) O-methyltransferase [candidate division NC10 bacterium]|nr:protein-L-isoaspartate(D-aspartate) O-methyltransferase [candidate division NC10 bacterium]
MEFAIARERMVADQLRARGITDARVLTAMGRVPRHRFVEEALAARAYGDYPLPIGEKQTISQPYMVALMTQALELVGGERVLEVGTGSGYQTAILAEVAGKVYSIERIRGLADRARAILEELGYYNVLIHVGDGTLGWREEAPFDAVLVTAAAPEVPSPLVEQVKPGGRLVIPVGGSTAQILKCLVKGPDGTVRESELVGCVFVKLVGEQGWQG